MQNQVYMLGQTLGKMQFPKNWKNGKWKNQQLRKNSSLTIDYFIFYNSYGIAELMGNPVNQNVSAPFSCVSERIHIFSDTGCIGLASNYYNSLGFAIWTIIITGDYNSQGIVI